MRTIRIKAYKFDELSEQAKEKALSKWYENEDYPFLCDDLTESCKAILEDQGCTFKDITLLYSLSYSQGDGLCFTGSISKDGYTLNLSHNYRYYFATSITMDFTDPDGEDVDIYTPLKNIYLDVCKTLESEGYDILAYRMDNNEFSELCQLNGYEFYQDGKMI